MTDTKNAERDADGRITLDTLPQAFFTTMAEILTGKPNPTTSSDKVGVSGTLSLSNGKTGTDPQDKPALADVLALSKQRAIWDADLLTEAQKRAGLQDEDMIAWQKTQKPAAVALSVPSNPANTSTLDTIGTTTQTGTVGTLRTTLMPGGIKPAAVLPHMADDQEQELPDSDALGKYVLLAIGAAAVWFFYKSA